MPEEAARQYQIQMDRGNVIFFTEENQEKLKVGIPPEEWEKRVLELERQRVAAVAPPFIPLKDGWVCPKEGCDCVNAGELAQCSECKTDKPVGELLTIMQGEAHRQQVTNYEKMLDKIRDAMREKEAAKNANRDQGEVQGQPLSAG